MRAKIENGSKAKESSEPKGKKNPLTKAYIEKEVKRTGKTFKSKRLKPASSAPSAKNRDTSLQIERLMQTLPQKRTPEAKRLKEERAERTTEEK